MQEIKILSENNNSQNTDIGGFVSNPFGERYLFAINRNVFEDTDASTVFRSHFGDSVLKQHTFYIIAGTDSGLLYQYIKTHGIPKGSRYLFVELPQILVLLEDIDGSKELAVTTGENWLEQAKNMGAQNFAAQDRLILSRSLGMVHSHYKDYPPLWHQLKESFDAYSYAQKMVLSNYYFIISRVINLTENQTPAICLKNTFKGKTAVLLAGGPSLDELLPWVKQHRSNLLVIAISRISHSLIKAGIQPDICVSIDPQPINLCISQDMLEFQNGTLLVTKNHVNPSLLSSWGGQKMFIGPRYPWTTSLEPENLPEIDGTTVTDSAFSLAVEMGAAQVILGGADFCLNQEGYTHACGSREHTAGPRPTLAQQQVQTNSGMMANTLHAYQASAMSIDLQAQNAIDLGCRTINPAPGAMRLPHVEHHLLDAIQIEPLEKPVHDTLTDCTPPTDSSCLTRTYKEILGEVDRILKEVKAIKELSSKALIYNRKLFSKKESGAGFHNKEKLDRIDEQFNKKYADTTTFIRQFGVARFLPILLLDHENNVADIEESYRLDHQAFVKTSDELIEILQQARVRTLSRLEEEKPRPNVKHLLKQWQHDQQPGRAIQWAKQHASKVSQQPESLQQDLHAFQNTFDDTVEEHRRGYITRVERGTKLNGVSTVAKQFFNCKDQAGLLRMLAGLQKHSDHKQANYVIPLVEAYLAELRNQPEVAIKAYRRITEGPACWEALRRLFEIHTKAQEYDLALKSLETLASKSSEYSPMYADMLFATGDADTAVEVYTDYLLANPGDLDSMLRLGNIFRQCGSVEGVAWTMGYILDKDPANQAAQQILSEISIPGEPTPSEP